MPFHLEWTVYGDRLVREEFSRFTKGVKDFRPVFEDIQADLENRIMPMVFASGGARIGNNWPALSPAYAAYKASRYPGRPLLVLSGRLQSSVLRNTGDAIRKLGKKEFRFGTRVPWAIFHHRGTARMPRRRFFGLTNDDKVAWGKMVHRYVVGLMGRLRF